MKKRFLIVLSLILAALLLVVACDDQANNLGSGDSVVIPSLPEGAPSLSKDDLTEITKEPEEFSESDMILLDNVLGELKNFAIVESAEGEGPDLSEEARAIVFDFIDAFGKKGIELKGEGYALSFSANIEEMKFTVSGSFDNFEFDVVTLNGTVNSTIIPNLDYNPYDEESVPYTVDSDKTKITVNGKECSSLSDAIKVMMEVLKTSDSKLASANEAIPGFIKTINDFIGKYSVSSDMLTVSLNGKITDGGLVIGEDVIDLGEGLSVDLNSTAYTNKPLVYNGSEYRFFVYESGTIKIVNNPDYNESDYNESGYKEPPVLINVDETLNVILETSEKIGNQKIRLQAKISGEILKGSLEVDVLLDLNGKVIDLEALVSAE